MKFAPPVNVFVGPWVKHSVEYQFAITPMDKSMGTRPWQLQVDPALRYCRIVRDTGETYDEIQFHAIPARLALPEFAGTHKWPVFSFDGHALEFKVDRERLEFLKILTAACMALEGKSRLRNAFREKILWVAVGLLFIVAVTPVCVWIFLGVAEEFKKHWFGFAGGAFFLGLMLVVNSLRGISLLRKAREFQKTMQGQQVLPVDAEDRAADG